MAERILAILKSCLRGSDQGISILDGAGNTVGYAVRYDHCVEFKRERERRRRRGEGAPIDVGGARYSASMLFQVLASNCDKVTRQLWPAKPNASNTSEREF